MIDDLTALRLQLEWGADEAIGDVAVDRFAPAATPVRRIAPQAAPALPGAASPSAARTMDELLAEMAAFEACALRNTAMQFVRPDGNPLSSLVILGDAPSSDDDRSGRAFSGVTGALVDRVLRTIDLDRGSLLLATLVPWRPPGNRRLSDSEVELCLPFIHRLLGIVRPQRLVLMGTQTVRAFAGVDSSIRRLRGRWFDVTVQNEQLTIAALALPTPDQWLINAAAKQQLWSDLLRLRIAVTTG